MTKRIAPSPLDHRQEEDNVRPTSTANVHRGAASSHRPALASLSLAAPAIVRAQGRQTLKVSVGRQPWAAGNSPVTQYMIANKTFERYASDAGYDLTIDYRDYPSALPMVEAFVSGNLDFGMWGNTPDRAADRAEPADPAA